MKLKKILMLPLMVMGSLSMSSCSSSDSKIEIKRKEGLTESILLTSSTLRAKVRDNEDFILVVSDKSCGSCRAFDNILNSYISQTGAMIYKIMTDEADKSTDIGYKVTPTLYIFDDGKVKAKTDYNESNLSTTEGFTKYIYKYSYLSSRIRITEEKLRDLISSEETFIVEYTWDKCGDCKMADKLFLNKFIKNNKKEFYEFELSQYYDARKDNTDPIWLNMTKEFKLSREGSKDFGWNNGVVPTFQYYEKGVLTDAVVVYNDNMDAVSGPDGTISKLTITKTYFEDAPHMSKTFKRTDNENAYVVYQKKTASFFEGKVKKLFKKI